MPDINDWIIKFEPGRLVLTPIFSSNHHAHHLSQGLIEERLVPAVANFAGETQPEILEIQANEAGNIKPLRIRRYEVSKGNVQRLILTNVLWDDQAKAVAQTVLGNEFPSLFPPDQQ